MGEQCYEKLPLYIDIFVILQVNPEFLKQVAKPIDHPSLVVQECIVQERPSQASQGFTAEWPSGTLLRRASSDTDIPRISVQSPTTEEESNGRQEKRGGSRKGRLKHEKKLEAVAAHHSDTGKVHTL